MPFHASYLFHISDIAVSRLKASFLSTPPDHFFMRWCRALYFAFSSFDIIILLIFYAALLFSRHDVFFIFLIFFDAMPSMLFAWLFYAICFSLLWCFRCHYRRFIFSADLLLSSLRHYVFHFISFLRFTLPCWWFHVYSFLISTPLTLPPLFELACRHSHYADAVIFRYCIISPSPFTLLFADYFRCLLLYYFALVYWYWLHVIDLGFLPFALMFAFSLFALIFSIISLYAAVSFYVLLFLTNYREAICRHFLLTPLAASSLPRLLYYVILFSVCRLITHCRHFIFFRCHATPLFSRQFIAIFSLITPLLSSPCFLHYHATLLLSLLISRFSRWCCFIDSFDVFLLLWLRYAMFIIIFHWWLQSSLFAIYYACYCFFFAFCFLSFILFYWHWYLILLLLTPLPYIFIGFMRLIIIYVCFTYAAICSSLDTCFDDILTSATAFRLLRFTPFHCWCLLFRHVYAAFGCLYDCRFACLSWLIISTFFCHFDITLILLLSFRHYYIIFFSLIYLFRYILRCFLIIFYYLRYFQMPVFFDYYSSIILLSFMFALRFISSSISHWFSCLRLFFTCLIIDAICLHYAYILFILFRFFCCHYLLSYRFSSFSSLMMPFHFILLLIRFTFIFDISRYFFDGRHWLYVITFLHFRYADYFISLFLRYAISFAIISYAIFLLHAILRLMISLLLLFIVLLWYAFAHAIWLLTLPLYFSPPLYIIFWYYNISFYRHCFCASLRRLFRLYFFRLISLYFSSSYLLATSIISSLRWYFIISIISPIFSIATFIRCFIFCYWHYYWCHYWASPSHALLFSIFIIVYTLFFVIFDASITPLSYFILFSRFDYSFSISLY